MVDTNVYQILKDVADPMIFDINVDDMASPYSVLAMMDSIVFKNMVTAGTGYIDVVAFKALPTIYVGDRLAYTGNDREIAVGKLKSKIMTIGIEMTEDEAKRLRVTDPLIIRKGLEAQQRVQTAYALEIMEKWAIKPFASTADPDYDPDWRIPLGVSSTGTAGDPRDLNGGSVLDLSAIKLSGSAQTQRNVETLTDAITQAFTKIDYFTHREMPFGRIVLGCDPRTFLKFKNIKDILNTNQRSDKTYMADLEASGFAFAKSVWFDTTYVGAANDTADICAFADPMSNFLVYMVPDGLNGWDPEWRELSEKTGNYTTFKYAKYRRWEFAIQSRPYWINDSESAAYFYKPVLWFKVKPYATS